MYRVQLQNFEGPLDLLLFFIKRDELDIYDIPISYITEQFLEYIRFLDELDLSVASEFIYMASTLMAIKARMMIPEPETDEDEFSEEDPRYELVQALLEYKRYKEVSEDMAQFEKTARLSYTRGYVQPDQVEHEQKGEALREVTLLDIMAAFRNVMLSVSEVHYHDVKRFETDVETQSSFVVEHLSKHGRSSFREICSVLTSRIYVIVTFLAVLELIKENDLKLFVDENQMDFYLELFTPEDLDAAHAAS
ncbi:segregation/condensation protein A [Balneolales bacterium ANBcel1]|nr:segregation/condensation protein A [Balneolales bacterium ANBcel1]